MVVRYAWSSLTKYLAALLVWFDPAGHQRQFRAVALRLNRAIVRDHGIGLVDFGCEQEARSKGEPSIRLVNAAVETQPLKVYAGQGERTDFNPGSNAGNQCLLFETGENSRSEKRSSIEQGTKQSAAYNTCVFSTA